MHKAHRKNEPSNPHKVPPPSRIVLSFLTYRSTSTGMIALSNPVASHKLHHLLHKLYPPTTPKKKNLSQPYQQTLHNHKSLLTYWSLIHYLCNLSKCNTRTYESNKTICWVVATVTKPRGPPCCGGIGGGDIGRMGGVDVHGRKPLWRIFCWIHFFFFLSCWLGNWIL